MSRCGVDVRMYLPQWPRRLDPARRLSELGVNEALNVVGSFWIHPRFGVGTFLRIHRRAVGRADLRYTRVVPWSIEMARRGLVNHVEVHNVQQIGDEGQMEPLVAHHRAGAIGMLIPISRSAARILVEAGADADRVHVAPSGVDVGAYDGIARFDADRLDHPRVVHIGQLSDERGRHVFERVIRQGVGEVTLIGAGTRDAADGLRDAVRMPPVPAKAVPGWYGRSDLVLIPYQPSIRTVATMSPMKLFEAMASGRPIIASDLATVREIVEHERNALLVDAEDSQAWIAAIERLRDDRDLARTIAEQARRDAEAYDWSRRAEGILDAIARQQGLAPVSATGCPRP